MGLRRKYTRSLALFVVAFLCLNPASVVCLAYCNYQIQVASADHCPLKKKNSDCHGSKKKTAPQDATSIDTGAAKNCVVPLNVIAAPVEAKYGTSVETVAAPPVEKISPTAAVPVRSRQIPKFYYHPPPNDLRFERVRNQVFRI